MARKTISAYVLVTEQLARNVTTCDVLCTRRLLVRHNQASAIAERYNIVR